MASSSFYPDISGGSLVQWKLSKTAVEQGHQVTVVTVGREENPTSERVDGVEIRRPFPAKVSSPGQNTIIDLFRKMVYSLFLCIYLPYIAYNRDIDVVYSASHDSHPGCKIAGMVSRSPVVNFIGYTPSVGKIRRPLGYTLRILERINFNIFLGDRVYCRTTAAREIINDSTTAQVEIIHGVVNDDKLEGIEYDKFEFLPGNVDLIWVGRLVEIKKPFKAIEILTQLPHSYGLTFVGGGPKINRTRALVDENQLEDRVCFCGQQEHDVALKLISSADALLLTSQTEAYPTVVFEALSLGIHVFATPVGVLPEIEHPSLHLASVNELPAKIEEAEIVKGLEVDQETLDKYSMERYAQTMIKSWVDLSS
jgi:glycosyltransferase involved in cell wall biosynthesis